MKNISFILAVFLYLSFSTVTAKGQDKFANKSDDITSSIKNAIGQSRSLGNTDLISVEVSTDKGSYLMDETIEISITAKNNTDSTITLEFSNGCLSSYFIDGIEYDRGYPQGYYLCTMAFEYLNIPADSTYTLVHNHSLINTPLNIGVHDLNGNVQTYPIGLSSPPIQFEVLPNQGIPVNGIVDYRNESNTPLSDATVYLLSIVGDTLQQTQTNASGEYEFNILAGQYFITATCDKQWGGLNMLDFQRMRQYFSFQYQMDELQQMAANLDENAMINLFDAQLLRKKLSFQPTPQWIAPDFVFETKFVEIFDFSDQLNFNIKGLCSGDVDGSYIPLN